jgi:hypothetical protein
VAATAAADFPILSDGGLVKLILVLILQRYKLPNVLAGVPQDNPLVSWGTLAMLTGSLEAASRQPPYT